MDKLLFAKQKLANIKAEIARVRTSDFHHPGVKRVLDRIEQRFNDLASNVESVTLTARIDTLHQHNLRVNANIDYFHRVIGVILRSTNARNSFEMYDPILRIARRLLGDDTVLVLSCEWDFVPFSTPSIFGGVPNCTVVGLPVMEAANALVIPLAGHELGHALWRARNFNDEVQVDRETALINVFQNSSEQFTQHIGTMPTQDIRRRLPTSDWGQIPLESIQNICEEIFCDMLGVRLFGMGYLYAFEYLAAPSLGETDLREYPPFDARARYLVNAMNELVILEKERLAGCPDAIVAPEWPGLEGYATRFSADSEPDLDAYDRYLLHSAHQACETLVPRLRKLVDQVCRDADEGSATLGLPTFRTARDVLGLFARGIPAVGWLPDLVNAGWIGYLDSEFWHEKPTWRTSKFRFLNELVFKSLDVTEFEERRHEDAAEVRQAG